MVEISEEMVEAAAKGMLAGMGSKWENTYVSMREYWTDRARAALAAALPLIEAAVREHIACEAEEFG